MANRFYWLNKITSVIIATSLLSVFGLSCSPRSYRGTIETVNLGATPIELNALIYVAEEQGYFSDNGIKLKYKDYDTGVAAVDGLTKNEVDIALTTEYVIVVNALQKQDILDLATIDKALLFYLIARKDRGITSMMDLKGKNVGVPRRTIMEFYLGRMLELNGMAIQDITMVDIQAPNSPWEISSGSVDAVVAFEPNVTKISREMGDKVNIWTIQSFQSSFWSVVSTRQWVDEHSTTAKSFLKSIVKAEQYLSQHEKETKSGLQKRLEYDSSYINDVWPRNQFYVSLDRSLIAAMEDQARWMIKNNLTTEKQVPNFNDYVYEDALKAVKPEAVNIIR